MRHTFTMLLAMLVLALGFVIIQRAPESTAAQAYPTPLVVVDPGHGGWDPGAVRGSIYEKYITLSVSLRLGSFLMQRGLRVYYTRGRDTALGSSVLQDLTQRSVLANRLGATLFVSIHVNTEPTGTMAGPIVYFRRGSPSSRALATAVADSLTYLTGSRRTPRPIGQWVLTHSRMPAVNVEIGFFTHSRDALQMQSPGYQTLLASRIADGIIHYLNR